jgi:beta-aspartyl-dipeptidase (metallo-type)
MLSGKSGLIHFHVGTAKSKLDLLWKIVNESSIPITQLYPTHMSSRGPDLIKESGKWISAGGFCDFTADLENVAAKTLHDFKSRNLPISHITLSSDAFG